MTAWKPGRKPSLEVASQERLKPFARKVITAAHERALVARRPEPSMSASKKPAAFQWDDPFLFERQLTEDERMIRDAARAYAQDRLLPRVLEAYAHEKTDAAIFTEMGWWPAKWSGSIRAIAP